MEVIDGVCDGLQTVDDLPPPKGSGPEYLPTLAEIAAATAEIRAGWSPAEYERRAVGPRRVAWEVPGA